MCVILIADKRRLTASMIERAVETNPDGNGIAWIEDGAVRFRKGLSMRDAIDIASDAPLPYVFHARIATLGGIRPELCHPFPLDRRVQPCATQGRSTRGVLFHNGHWGNWHDYIDQGDGPWSDSRAMAELVSAYGDSTIREYVGAGQRVVLLTKHGYRRFGDGWSETHRGVWASNTCWLPRPVSAIRKDLQRTLDARQQTLVAPGFDYWHR